MKQLRSIAVFCGSSDQVTRYYPLARRVGKMIGQRSLRLVYGGGNWGMMGKVATSAYAHGAAVLGVIPKRWHSSDPTTQIGEYVVVKHIHDRKRRMYREADAVLVLPGGFGTLEELSEVMSWNACVMHKKPCCILNAGGFYNPITDLIRNIEAADFASIGAHRTFMAYSAREAFELLYAEFAKLA